MPKGEYDTPGPFYLEEAPTNSDAFLLKYSHGDHAQYVGVLSVQLDETERDALVLLLNNGRHFAEMLAALKEAYGLPDYVGIDETEDGEKELVVSCEIWRERWGDMIAKLTGQSTD